MLCIEPDAVGARVPGEIAMAIETVGSTETLLQLLATCQGRNGRRADPVAVWRQIVEYQNRGGKYRFYPFFDLDPDRPAGEYLFDLGSLVKAKCLALGASGAIEVTPVRRSFA